MTPTEDTERDQSERDEALYDMTHEQLVRRAYERTDGDFAVMRYVYELQRRLRLRGEDDGGREVDGFYADAIPATYRDCHDDEHPVEAVGQLTSDGQVYYIIRVPPEEHGVLVAIDRDGREWWDGYLLVTGPARLSMHATPPSTDRSGAEHKARVFTMPAPKSVQGRDYQARCSCGWKSGRFVTKSVVERKRQRHLENATPDPDDGTDSRRAELDDPDSGTTRMGDATWPTTCPNCNRHWTYCHCPDPDGEAGDG